MKGWVRSPIWAPARISSPPPSPCFYSCLLFDRPFHTEYGAICYLPLIALGLRIPAPRHWPVWAGWEFSFPVQFFVCRVAHSSPLAPGICRQFSRVARQYYDQRTWLRHCASSRDAEPQYDQKVNNKLGPYPVENGLSKRKQLYAIDPSKCIPEMTSGSSSTPASDMMTICYIFARVYNRTVTDTVTHAIFTEIQMGARIQSGPSLPIPLQPS